MAAISRRHRFRAPKHPKLFDAIGKQHIGRTLCFLCGRRLTPGNRSDEHVFPKWLQARYQLWNQELTLLNGTAIPYRTLKIPCCRACNSHHLSRVENAVKRAVARGPSAVRALSRQTLFVWLSKILYGILYKEGLLRFDRTAPGTARLVPRPMLKTLEMHHYFLQSVRVPMCFFEFFPASIFVFRLQRSHDSRFRFNFRDMPATLGIALQMGSVGIVAVLQDGGAQERGFASYLARYHQYPLHPLQFLELVATVFYKATLFNRVPKYLTMESVKALQVIQMPLQGFSLKPLYNDWSQETYAQLLSFHTGQPFSLIFVPPERVMTWLNRPDGEPRFMDIKSLPWPGSVVGSDA